MTENSAVPGFKEDCLSLVNAFLCRNTFRFEAFSEEWKRKHFHFIFTLVIDLSLAYYILSSILQLNVLFSLFSGHIFDYELLQFTEACMLILKALFLQSRTISERIAVLYLMYSVYFKQPTNDYCKYRITLKDWNEMKHFYNTIANDAKYMQARLIFWRLWQTNAFRFVASEGEYGVEVHTSSREFQERYNEFQSANPLIANPINAMTDKSSGLLTALEIIQIGYNEMKEHLSNTVPECSGLANTNCLRDILPRMEKICERFDGNKLTRMELRQRMQRKKVATLQIDDENDDDDYVESSSGDEYRPSTSVKNSDKSFPNIGSKRSYLRQKAMRKSDKEESANESGKNRGKEKQTTSKSKKGRNLVAPSSRQPETQPKRLQLTKQRIELNGRSGNLIIFSPGAPYTRRPAAKTSIVQKEFDSCPM